MSCFSAKVTTASVAEPDPTKHVNYNLGMVLGVDDFTQEFAYLSGRDQWMARDLIGYGTVRGLKLGLEDSDKGARIAVEPGVAVSPRGQMICVPAAQCAYLKDWIEQHSKELSDLSPPEGLVKLYVVLCYRDCPTDNVPIAGEPCRSEDQLVAASRLTDDFCLELRLKAPIQREEDAVRDFVEWLKQIDVSDGELSSSSEKDVLDAIRAAAAQWLASPLSSPPGDFMFGAPPASLHIQTGDGCAYLRAAFRLWVTELRPKWYARWHGCAATHFDADDQTEEDCVMLAELTVPIATSAPGNWTIVGEPPVDVDESRRPFVIHLRMLQEWLLCGCACSRASGPPILEGAEIRDVANITSVVNITNVIGAAKFSLTSEQQLIVCDSSRGAIVLALPPAEKNVGRVFIVKHISPGTHGVKITADGSDLIDDKASAALTAPLKFIELVGNVVADRGVWHIIGRS